ACDDVAIRDKDKGFSHGEQGIECFLGALFQLTTLGDVLTDANCTDDVVLFVIKRGTANAEQQRMSIAIMGDNVYSVSAREDFAVEDALDRPLILGKWTTLLVERSKIV